MKQKTKETLATIVGFLIAVIVMTAIGIAISGATAPPTVDNVTSPIDAGKYTLTGTAEAEAKITITGGHYELSPIYADENGYWEKTVTLIQESTNTFSITAYGADEETSSAVVVTIEEGEEITQEYETTYSVDRTAPNEPMVDAPESPVDADTAIITGTTEASITVIVTGDASEETTSNSLGEFSIEVNLIQNEINKFYVAAIDDSGNMSSTTKVEIIESGPEDTTEEPVEPSGYTISIEDFAFVEDTLEIYEGDSVTWTNNDSTDHTISSDQFEDSETLVNGDTYTLSFDTAGTYYYICGLHPTMTGTITVLEYEVEAEPETAVTADFPDIDGHWAEDYIVELATEEVINGYDDGTFGPDNYITRAEITKIALNAFGYDTYAADSAFSDVADDAWYADYVNSAAEYEIIGEYDDGTFLPGEYVNRAEAMKILIGASGIVDMAGAHIFIGEEDSWYNPFPDVESGAWYYQYIMQGFSGGIISGYVDGTFGPGNNITRAEVCKVVLNLTELKLEIAATPTI